MANDPDQWTQDDAIKLRDYIASHPKFLRVLTKTHRPKIEGNTVEARAVTGSDMNGFLVCIDAIDAMQRDPANNVDNAGFITEDTQN